MRLGLDIKVGRKRVERLMRTARIAGVTRRRSKTRRSSDAVPSDDVVARRFRPEGSNELWVADITEHPTGEGKVYCAVVIDAWNRQVVGHSIADHLRAELIIDALDAACWRQRPVAGQTIHHSDHGCQGELNRWSQHLSMSEVRRRGDSRWPTGRFARRAFTVTTDPGASGGARVLASDLSGQEHRGTPPSVSGCRSRSARAGFVTLAAWRL